MWTRGINKAGSWLSLLCLVAAFLGGCSWGAGVEPLAAGLVPVRCIAVLPVVIAPDVQVDKREQALLAQGAELIDQALAENLAGRQQVRRISAVQLADISAGTNHLAGLRQLATAVGCDAVLETEIRRYQQRDGGAYSINSPASVAFDLRLIQAATGKAIWFASVDETQDSVLNNLFSWNKAQSRGFKWVTVEELVRQGVRDALVDCPYLQESGLTP